MIEDADDIYTVNVTLHPEDSGALRTVMVGLGKPTVVVEAVMRDDDLVIEVEGSGDQLEVAALLYTVALAIDPSIGDDAP